MNILFLTLVSFESLQERNIYTDLLREFVKNGHQVYAISPTERKQNQETHLIKEENVTILRLRIGNTQKTNIIEKGISTVMIEPTFKKAIREYFSDVKFDLVLYSTPPITLVSAIEYVKKRDGAKTYLMLKDIFPQNAVDIGMMSKTGIKGLLYKYFRNQEKKLYRISDRIGCMSQANVDYVIKHNPEIPQDKIEICPNCVEPIDMRVSEDEKNKIRKKYDLPLDKKIFVYGGNLGRPQDVPFIVECLRACADIKDSYFVIAGSGTDRHFLEEYVEVEKPSHVKLFGVIPKAEYDKMIACCDVGLIFLDHCFTIPNFPSRLLSYMQAGLPVLACTDPNTDVGKVIVDGEFGWWCENYDTEGVDTLVGMVCHIDTNDMGSRAWAFLNNRYNVSGGYQIIMNTWEK